MIMKKTMTTFAVAAVLGSSGLVTGVSVGLSFSEPRVVEAVSYPTAWTKDKELSTTVSRNVKHATTAGIVAALGTGTHDAWLLKTISDPRALLIAFGFGFTGSILTAGDDVIVETNYYYRQLSKDTTSKDGLVVFRHYQMRKEVTIYTKKSGRARVKRGKTVVKYKNTSGLYTWS